jgi:hypothetical protein
MPSLTGGDMKEFDVAQNATLVLAANARALPFALKWEQGDEDVNGFASR